ncbi:MAG: restriction endonuclease, partial [Gammaproteobacteria bacterium]|nr:restriction endonuclease [Gammaproteobacteria bacterium]
LLSSGILVSSEPKSVSFVHLTFMEFYAARRLVETPRKLASLLVEVGPIVKETMLFAAGLILDVAPLVELAVDRRELILAANCLREGRTENRILEAYVLDQLQRELGSELIKKLAGGVIDEKRPQPESIHTKLRRQLSELRNSNLPSHEKGKRFEEFAKRFFKQSFNVIDVNRNTENGEIDLILENKGTDPFWTEWGGDIFVECKNWSVNRPLKETATFSNKVRMSRGKLGFFVSVSGFTEDALRTLKNQVADRDAPLIVPITGESMESMLDHHEKFDLFFRASIRNIKHLHKW